MTPLAKALTEHVGKFPTVPDHLFCAICGYIRHSAETLTWLRHNRPDLGGLPWNTTCLCQRGETERRGFNETRRRDANLPLRNDTVGARTIENFEAVDGTAEMINVADAFSRGEGPPMLLFVGVVGCGKTHLLEAIGRNMLEAGQSVRYERAEDWLGQLRHTFNNSENGDITDLLNWYDSFNVLLIDDIGMQKSTQWGAGYLTNLVDRRYMDGTRLVAATNLIGRDALAERWEERLASRLYDERTGAALVVGCQATDYRRRSKVPVSV
jgi:DNA replication protein DnaC